MAGTQQSSSQLSTVLILRGLIQLYSCQVVKQDLAIINIFFLIEEIFTLTTIIVINNLILVSDIYLER